MNKKKYCIFCGAENTADADTCCACGRTMHPEEHLLKEYLYRKTKGKLQGKAEDSFLSVLKNWILSHLYGLVVTISLVALATITVSASFSSQPPYVRRISSPLTPAEQALAIGNETGSVTAVPETPAVEEQNDEMIVTEEDTNEVSHLTYEFDYYYMMEITLAGVEFYIESDEAETMQRANLDDCIVPEASGYRGEFVYGELDHSHYNYNEVRLDPGKPHINEPATELGERIMADGHPIIVYHATNHYSGQGTEYTRSFIFTATRLDGKWYFAEVLSLGDL
ncbi:MAG: hypothetical protein IJI75_02650 [Solobacterium sp.]|nr:hypothetical protein [Solobacterium sp.]